MTTSTSYEQGKMEYLRTKVLTASPEELHLMLYDGAIRFAEEAKAAFGEGNIEKAHHSLIRAQNIVLEMSSGLDHQADPDLCAKLSSLYNFIYRRLTESNLRREVGPIDDALKILNYQRETWVLLMDKVNQERREETAGVLVSSSAQGSPEPASTFGEPGGGLSLSA